MVELLAGVKDRRVSVGRVWGPKRLLVTRTIARARLPGASPFLGRAPALFSLGQVKTYLYSVTKREAGRQKT